MFQPIAKKNHLTLGNKMFTQVSPANFPKSVIRYQNIAWAKRLGLQKWLDDDQTWIDHCAKFKPLKNSLEFPIALAYHGHQFGVYNPEIGDGRGFLYAQILDPHDRRLLDLGTKGSGQTPYSRTGDGRLTLKGGVREILATQMLDALGVNTAKTFSLIETGESLERHDEPSPTRAAVLVRLAHGHIRIGSFQRLAYLNDRETLEKLLRYAARNYYPDSLDHSDKASSLAAAFLEAVAQNIAELTASMMAAGFAHGVLNTDNYNITGECFDYGPWRFIPYLDPAFTAAYFDHQGRYAYGRQPQASLWAVCRLADVLTMLGEEQKLQNAIDGFQIHMQKSMTQALCRRLGIDPGWEGAEKMAEHLFKAMRASQCPFEATFFDWHKSDASDGKRALKSPRKNFYQSTEWLEAADLIRQAPAYLPPHAPPPSKPHKANCLEEEDSPQTMLIEDVESIWHPIDQSDNWKALDDKLDAIEKIKKIYRLAKQI